MTAGILAPFCAWPWESLSSRPWAYQATMPGIEEELVYRGILWALVAAALPGHRYVGGIPVSWALVLTTLMFAFVHGLRGQSRSRA